MMFFEHSKDSSGLAVLPTGAGKSLILSWVSLSLWENKKQVLMVVPSIELLRQNKEKIEAMGGIVGVFSGSKKETDKPLTIATIQSLNKNSDALNKFKYIMVDEAHFKYPYKKGALFFEFVKKTKPKKILGLTATPFLMENTAEYSTLRVLPSLKDTFFKNIIHITQVPEVIAEGRWAKLKYVSYPFVFEGLILNSTGNDYTEESVEAALALQNVNNSCCIVARDTINEKSSNKVIIFVESLKTAALMREYLRSKCSKRIEIVSADTKTKPREEYINTFTNTEEIGAIINVGTLVRGFDCPTLTHVLLARPTNSLNSYYQMLGRLVRIHKSKPFGTVVDFCSNVERFGIIENLMIQDIKGLGWSCFNKEILLTNVNLKLGKKVTVKEAMGFEKPKKVFSRMKMPFGKHKGKLVVYLPKFYQKFLYEDMSTSAYLSKDAKEVFTLLKEIKTSENATFIV